MKTRYFGFAAIVILQACSTAPTSELGAMQTVETTAEIECGSLASRDNKVCRWTDEEGNVFYSDGIPREFADRPKPPHNGEGERSAEQLEVESVTQECQLRADQQLLESYLNYDGYSAHSDGSEELLQGQCRVIGLNIQFLKDQLACLEASADTTKDEESLLQRIHGTREAIQRHQEKLVKCGEEIGLSTIRAAASGRKATFRCYDND